MIQLTDTLFLTADELQYHLIRRTPNKGRLGIPPKKPISETKEGHYCTLVGILCAALEKDTHATARQAETLSDLVATMERSTSQIVAAAERVEPRKRAVETAKPRKGVR